MAVHRVVMFEPDEEFAGRLAGSLAELGWETARVPRAAEAARLCASSDGPTALFVEPFGPGLEGLEGLRGLADVPSRPPVVAVTSFPTLTEGLPAVDCVVAKSVGTLALRRVLGALAEGRVPAHELPDAADEKRRSQRRFKELLEVGLLDGSLDARLHALAARTAEALDAPMSFVTVTLPDEVIVKAAFGLSLEQDAGVPLLESFCRHAVLGESLLEIPDANAVPVLARTFAALGGSVVAYLGAPLFSGAGVAIGTLCVADRRPRRFSADDRELLGLLSRRLSQEIELGAAAGGDLGRTARPAGPPVRRSRPLVRRRIRPPCGDRAPPLRTSRGAVHGAARDRARGRSHPVAARRRGRAARDGATDAHLRPRRRARGRRLPRGRRPVGRARPSRPRPPRSCLPRRSGRHRDRVRAPAFRFALRPRR